MMAVTVAAAFAAGCALAGQVGRPYAFLRSKTHAGRRSLFTREQSKEDAEDNE